MCPVDVALGTIEYCGWFSGGLGWGEPAATHKLLLRVSVLIMRQLAMEMLPGMLVPRCGYIRSQIVATVEKRALPQVVGRPPDSITSLASAAIALASSEKRVLIFCLLMDP